MPTAIQNIPEELLLVIFNNLSGRDLIQCEQVCRSWYIPARVKYLNRRVVLKNNSRIKRFITAINRNPNPRFLAAVKGIQTWTTASTKNWNVTDTVMYNLLFRFPNLESVEINGALLNKFNDNVCRKFLHHCPKLQDLSVYGLKYDTYGPLHAQLYRVRLLLTVLEFREDRIDDIEQFVTSFPRLKSLCTVNQLVNFEEMLPILATLPALSKIKFRKFVNDNEQFLERYWQLKTSDERHQLVERISLVTELSIECATFISNHVLGFISKYMTGLKYLEFDRNMS